mgnify:CR=1 FL=1
MESTTEKNIATFTHLSTLTQYFIPFGNYIFPIILWTSKKDKSDFVDYHGKQVLNFQLSILLYSIITALIAIPILVFTIFNDDSFVVNNFNFSDHIALLTVGLTAVFLFGCLKVAEFFLIIYASIKTSAGELYKYPISIPFIK